MDSLYMELLTLLFCKPFCTGHIFLSMVKYYTSG